MRENQNTPVEQAEMSWLRPSSDSGSTILQTTAAKVDEVIEPLIVVNIGAALEHSPNSLVIYGTGHFAKQAAADEKAFVKPKIEYSPERWTEIYSGHCKLPGLLSSRPSVIPSPLPN